MSCVIFPGNKYISQVLKRNSTNDIPSVFMIFEWWDKENLNRSKETLNESIGFSRTCLGLIIIKLFGGPFFQKSQKNH